MILIYTEHISPRLQWITNILFDRMMGVALEITDDLPYFLAADRCKINYSTQPVDSIPTIHPHAILFHSDIPSMTIDMRLDGSFSFFQNKDSWMGFDLFAASFYLLSRYEEHLPHRKDKHGRYAFDNSLAHQYGFIETPIVDRWMWTMKEKLKSHYPKIEFRSKAYQTLPTMDIDVAYAYKGRSVFRNIRSTTKDMLTANTQRLKQRRQVKKGKTDPFDTYDYYHQLLRKHDLKSQYFFLLGDYGPFDKNIHYQTPELQQLISSVGSAAGSHLSYASHESKDKARAEKKRLEEITGAPVRHNRFHYLKFSVVHSYPMLVELGYTADYSMTYPEAPGFRASTCYPYPFFDLKKNQTTDLILYPTTVMDASCQDYLQLSPEDSIVRIQKLMDEVKKVQGFFIPLWHNDSLSEEGKWKGWRKVFEYCLEYMCS